MIEGTVMALASNDSITRAALEADKVAHDGEFY